MENNNINITYMGKEIKVLQYISESDSQFKKRLDFIGKLENKSISSKDAVKYSKIWYFIRFKKCKYSSDIYTKIIKLEE